MATNRLLRLILIVIVLLVLAACRSAAPDQGASRSAPPNGFDEFAEFENEIARGSEAGTIWDPLEPVNRGIFWFNDKLYFYAFKPVARGYGSAVSEPTRVSVDNFFSNLEFPLRFANNVLQLKLTGAGKELGRFAVNTTLGVGGLFDPAGQWFGWKEQNEDFGQTLGYYGMGPVMALQLPFTGPSNLRDVIGKIPEYFLDPLNYLEPTGAGTALRNYDRVNFVSLNIGWYEELKADALDPYVFFRDAYQQRREHQSGKVFR